jgi:hypothetical protein
MQEETYAGCEWCGDVLCVGECYYDEDVEVESVVESWLKHELFV